MVMVMVMEGMRFSYTLRLAIRNGVYRIFPRYEFDTFGVTEEILIHMFELSGADADYSGMARRYRRYQLERGACLSLRDRRESWPVAALVSQGPLVRLRLARKPVPPSVEAQTETNEPPITAMISFDRVCEIMERFHRAGIRDAEFSLGGLLKSYRRVKQAASDFCCPSRICIDGLLRYE